MQLHNTVNEVSSNIGNQSKSFTIAASQKAFKILSSSLYQNKIQAIVRELSTNAVDAHVAAKNPEQFIVHLPCKLEPYFSVKDFGTGLSDEQVMNLYTTYFASTKADSDEFIGALGLGSKSPFSYVDSFTITSITNNKKRTYSAFISAEGFPQVLPVEVVDTDEHNGMEVSFPVRDQDFTSFVNEAVKVYFAFNTKPLITGAVSSFTETEKKIVGDYSKAFLTEDWELYTKAPAFFGSCRSSTFYFYSYAYVKMGNTLYPIEAEPFRDFQEEPYFKFGLNNRFVYNMPLGTCNIAPSREALDYDERTVRNIMDACKKTYETFNSGVLFQGIINDPSKSLHQKLQELEQIHFSVGGGFDFSFQHMGINFNIGKTYKVPVTTPVTHHELQKTSRGSTRLSMMEVKDGGVNFTCSSKTLFFVANKPTMCNSSYMIGRLKTYMRENKYSKVVLFATEPTSEELAKLGNPELFRVNVLPKEEYAGSPTASSSGIIKKTGVTLDSDTASIDLTDDVNEHYYVVLKSQGFWFWNGSELEKFGGEYAKEDLRCAGFSWKRSVGPQVVIVPYTSFNALKISEKKNWKAFNYTVISDYINEAYKPLASYRKMVGIANKARKLECSLFVNRFHDKVSLTSSLRQAYNDIEALRSTKADPVKEDLISKLYDLAQLRGVHLNDDCIDLVYRSYEGKIDIDENFFEAYPMLRHLVTYSLPSDKVMLDYINLVDASQSIVLQKVS